MDLLLVEMLLVLPWIIPFALFAHELGHKIVANYYGCETKITFSFKGVYCDIEYEEPPSSLRWKIISLSGGMSSSFMLTILFFIFGYIVILIFIPYEFARALQEYYTETRADRESVYVDLDYENNTEILCK